MVRCISICIFLTIIGCSQAIPQIVSRPEIISAYVGQAVMMKCLISNPASGEASWSSVTYDFKIYQGSQLLTDDIRYSIKSGAGGMMYHLQILNVSKSDQGFYKCAIEESGQQIISQINVLEWPSKLLPQASPLNVTDCCIKEGVTQSCMPICYPGQIDIQKFSLTTNCGTAENLQGLSKCFTDGSNHDNCCLNAKVDALCLDICHNTVPKNLSTEYFSRCYADKVIKEIFSCFELGFESLPSEPTQVTAVALCEASSENILVKWLEPIKNSQMVTGYKIMYKSRMQKTYNSVLVKNSAVNQYKLTNKKNGIISDMDYNVHVSALADHGISFQSVEVNVYLPNCTEPDQQNTSIIGKPTYLVVRKIDNSVDVLLTWDMNEGDQYSSFKVLYKTLTALKYLIVSNITTKYYRLTDLQPLTEYTVHVEACGDGYTVCQTSLNVYFVSGSSGKSNRQSDDDEMIKVEIGVGVSVSIIVLITIVLFVIYICRARLLSSRMKTSMTFDYPDYYSSKKVKLQDVNYKHSCDEKQEVAAGILVIDNTSAEKSKANYDNQNMIYWTPDNSSASTTPLPQSLKC